MILKPEVSVGDILTIVSILISVIALLISWQRNQEIKRKEFADKIRRGASTVVVKFQRWRELSLRFFEDIQPLITEADMGLGKNGNVSEVRDIFWMKIADFRTKTSQRIIDEQVETAYIDLFGFDPRIQTLINEVIIRLKIIDESIYTQTRYSTQADILTALSQSEQYTTSKLGNKLRNTCYVLTNKCQQLMDEAIEPFSKEMVKLIELGDLQIVNRRFKTSAIPDLFPFSLDQLKEKLNKEVDENLAQIAKSTTTSIQSNFFTPLIHENKGVIGVIVVDDYHQDKVPNILQNDAAVFANEAAKVINQAKNKKELEQVNRRKFNEKALPKRKRKNIR